MLLLLYCIIRGSAGFMMVSLILCKIYLRPSKENVKNKLNMAKLSLNLYVETLEITFTESSDRTAKIYIYFYFFLVQMSKHS